MIAMQALSIRDARHPFDGREPVLARDWAYARLETYPRYAAKVAVNPDQLVRDFLFIANDQRLARRCHCLELLLRQRWPSPLLAKFIEDRVISREESESGLIAGFPDKADRVNGDFAPV